MIDVRIRARTKVGMTRKKSVIRIRSVSSQPPTKPEITPSTPPSRTVMSVASSPITIEIRAPWTVRFSMSRPQLVGAEQVQAPMAARVDRRSPS